MVPIWCSKFSNHHFVWCACIRQASSMWTYITVCTVLRYPTSYNLPMVPILRVDTEYLRICSVTAHIACISHFVGIRKITWKMLALHRKTSIKQNALDFTGSLANCVSLCAMLKHLPSSIECKIQYLRRILCYLGVCVVVIIEQHILAQCKCGRFGSLCETCTTNAYKSFR